MGGKQTSAVPFSPYRKEFSASEFGFGNTNCQMLEERSKKDLEEVCSLEMSFKTILLSTGGKAVLERRN